MRNGIVIGFLVALFLGTGAALGADSPRERLLLDWNWQFQLGDPPEVGTSLDYPEIKDLAKMRNAEVHTEEQLAATRPSTIGTHVGENLAIVKPDFDASSWRKLDLPHDWAVELPFDQKANFQHGFKDLDPKKGTTIGWYRRTFSLRAADKGRTLTVEFDGVYRNSLVWINGHVLGRHPSGYTSFEYDITKYANCGDGDAGKNTLVVRVDATRTEGWFYEGAGIYRHVWLTKTNATHVAHWGTYVTTDPDSPGHVTARITAANDSDADVTFDLVSEVHGADGKVLDRALHEACTIPAHRKQELTPAQDLLVQTPILWSPDNTVLYTLVTTLKRGDTVLDRYETPFGIRTIKFDPNQGMLLNGKRIELYGTCNHQDHAGVGAAIPDALQSFRLERLKDFGCNAIRTSHNEPTPELLDACDRLGILVMDENRRMGTDKESAAEMESLVLRDRNHPSVFIWSVGNEETLQGDDTDGVANCNAMQGIAHRLDPSRKCTVAMNNAWGLGFSNVIDVIGFNYAARKTRNGISVDEYHAKYPDRPMIGTEDASTVCTRGIYGQDADGNISADIVDPKNAKLATDPELKRKGYVPAYDTLGTATAEKWWNFFADRPFLPGSFVWTGFDYRGEPTPYKWPCINSHFGVLDTCGFPKDIFYYYQACWTNKSVVHLLPHWNWPGKEGKTIDVWAFSNCDEVELSLNGQIISRQKMPPRQHLEWKMKYAPGTLLAKGFKDGVQVTQDKIETTGAAQAVQLAPDRTEIRADRADVSVITVSAADADNRPVPTAENEINFSVTGPGKIIGVGNGDPSSHEPDKADKRHLFNGLAQVIVQSTGDAGDIQVTARGENLKSASVTIHTQPTTVQGMP